MDLSSVTLFLGAGVSVGEPAGGPLFAEVRDACAKRAGVDTTNSSIDATARLLLDNAIPEVFLKLMDRAGYQLDAALARAVRGTPGIAPNVVHAAAAHVLDSGGTVWTTNWDEWIETAYRNRTGRRVLTSVHPNDPDPAVTSFGKLHGTASDPESLRFTSSQILQPLPSTWHDALVESCRNRLLFVAGYGGAAIDLFPALRDAIDTSAAAYWFEGVGGTALDDSELAAYERWRFDLASVADPRGLPTAGRHLVWCGDGSSLVDKNPSAGLLDVLGLPGAPIAVPGWSERFDAVDAEVSKVEQHADDRGKRLQLEAVVNERLGARRRAARLHAQVLVVGTPSDKRRSRPRSIADLTLLRDHALRRALNRLYRTIDRRPESAKYLALQAGGVDHDPDQARRIAAEPNSVDVDQALNHAMSTRWADDLRVAERISRAQLTRALEHDAVDNQRDWPERVSRASFEITQSLVWQGRFDEADDVSRVGYMRVSGAKWTAWEHAMRAVVRYNHGDYTTAGDQFAICAEILDAEGFTGFAPSAWIGQAASARSLGDHAEAQRHLDRVLERRDNGAGTTAALLAERAEQRLARRREREAATDWSALTESPLPLWRAIGHLRLAESGYDPDRNLDQARAAFGSIGCEWGTIRCDANANSWTRSDIEARTTGLGPPEPFIPANPWLM